MTSQTYGISPNGRVTLGAQLKAGTVIKNLDSANAIWVSEQPNVGPGVGVLLNAYASITWAEDAPCYATVDTGVTAVVQVIVSDAIASIDDPVALGAAIAIKLLNQVQPVSVGNIVTVKGITQVEQMSQVTLLGTMTFTCVAGQVIPTGVYDLTVHGLSQYASVLVTIASTYNQPTNPVSLNHLLNGQFVWGPGTVNGGAETNAYWHLSQLSSQTDFIQLPCLNDALELTFGVTSAATTSTTYTVNIYGSNLFIPKIRYSQGGGAGLDPGFPYYATYSAATATFDYVPSTNGRFFFNLRANSTAGAARLYALNLFPWNSSGNQAIASAQFPVGTQPAVSFPVEMPGSLAPIALQMSIITAGAAVLTSQAEIV